MQEAGAEAMPACPQNVYQNIPHRFTQRSPSAYCSTVWTGPRLCVLCASSSFLSVNTAVVLVPVLVVKTRAVTTATSYHVSTQQLPPSPNSPYSRQPQRQTKCQTMCQTMCQTTCQHITGMLLSKPAAVTYNSGMLHPYTCLHLHTCCTAE